MSENMDSIQQEAMRRMQDMQTRAKGQQSRMNVQRQPAAHPPKEQHTPVPDVPAAAPHTPHEKTEPAKDLLAGLFEDKERNLILLLILMLSSENADSGLLLALMYLII